MNCTILKADRRNAFQLTPAADTISLSQSSDFANTTPNSNRFDFFNRAYDLALRREYINIDVADIMDFSVEFYETLTISAPRVNG